MNSQKNHIDRINNALFEGSDSLNFMTTHYALHLGIRNLGL